VEGGFLCRTVDAESIQRSIEVVNGSCQRNSRWRLELVREGRPLFIIHHEPYRERETQRAADKTWIDAIRGGRSTRVMTPDAAGHSFSTDMPRVKKPLNGTNQLLERAFQNAHIGGNVFPPADFTRGENPRSWTVFIGQSNQSCPALIGEADRLFFDSRDGIYIHVGLSPVLWRPHRCG
jgi:hypothetical protein